MKPENLQLFQKLVSILILALVLIRVVSALFFLDAKLALMGIRLPVFLSMAVILLLLLYGYLKSCTGGTFLGKLSYNAFLLTTIAALLIYIVVTRIVHQRQVGVLNELIKKLEK